MDDIITIQMPKINQETEVRSQKSESTKLKSLFPEPFTLPPMIAVPFLLTNPVKWLIVIRKPDRSNNTT